MNYLTLSQVYYLARFSYEYRYIALLELDRRLALC